MELNLGTITLIVVILIFVVLQFMNQAERRRQKMKSNEEKPDENHSKKDKPANSVNADWTMVLFGIGATGLGIAIVTNLITVNIFYQNIRWLLIVIGIIAILWGFASGKKR